MGLSLRLGWFRKLTFRLHLFNFLSRNQKQFKIIINCQSPALRNDYFGSCAFLKVFLEFKDRFTPKASVTFVIKILILYKKIKILQLNFSQPYPITYKIYTKCFGIIHISCYFTLFKY